jgi:REP element-mobilizing transposase RayT
MEEPRLTITFRRLPHWTLPGSTYFITFRLATGTLDIVERRMVLEHVKSGHAQFYGLAAAVVMPDHVHLILKPLRGFTLSRIMKGIKGVAARRLNQHRKTSGQVWQDESWDRILRDAREFEEKLQYMYNNPLKAGLATDGSLYEGWFYNPDFT